MMRTHIDVVEYRAAFVTWLAVSGRTEGEIAVARSALAELPAKGTFAIVDLCNELRNFVTMAGRNHNLDSLVLAVDKSSLLDRLVYAGEKLREKPCPIHEGRWQGCYPEPCRLCNYGCQTTGWLKPDLDGSD
jgi:hypothetical protein